MTELERIDKARLVLEAALERKAESPIVLDVRKVSSFADTFVILTGRSDRQVRAIAEGIARALKDAGDRPIGIEGVAEGHWVLIDCSDLIVHVFDPSTRAEYALERLWSDAPSLERELGLNELVAAGGGDAKAMGDVR